MPKGIKGFQKGHKINTGKKNRGYMDGRTSNSNYEITRKQKYYQENKERIKKNHDKYRQDNKEEGRKYRQEHKKERSEYLKKRRQEPKFRLDSNISSAIRKALKGRKNNKRWETLVGYTVQDLITHLESLFDNKMNWENQGSYWHIDHIKPQSLFHYETAEDSEFKLCWALSNLQPLEAIENIKKHNHYKN